MSASLSEPITKWARSISSQVMMSVTNNAESMYSRAQTAVHVQHCYTIEEDTFLDFRIIFSENCQSTLTAYQKELPNL